MLCVRWHGGTSGIVWFRPVGRAALPGSTSFTYRMLAPFFRTSPPGHPVRELYRPSGRVFHVVRASRFRVCIIIICIII